METVGGLEAGRGGVLGDGRRPEIDFTAGYCSTRESASRKMRVTPTLRFARALRDDTEPSSAYTATIWWLFAFVGLANWFFVFCLFVQVPVLIAVKDPGLGGSDGHHHTGGLPEGIRLSSFLNVFQQLGNGIALGMMFSLRASAIPTFGTLLLLAAVAASATMAALLPCANDLSVNEAGCDNGFIVRQVWGHRRSVGVWCAAFVSGIIGSSGNLIVVPYMSRFRSAYTSAYFAGTGLSGIFASALAAAQVWGASDASPNFGPDTFCAVVSASCSASLVAWLAIVKMDYDYDAAEAALCSAGVTRHGHAIGTSRHRRGGVDETGAGTRTGPWPGSGSGAHAAGTGGGSLGTPTRGNSGRSLGIGTSGAATPARTPPPQSPTRRRSSGGGDVHDDSLERPLLSPPASPPPTTRRQLHSLYTARPPRDYVDEGPEDLENGIDSTDSGLGGIGTDAAHQRVSTHRASRLSMLRRVAPVMAVNCLAGVANYGLCVPAYAFAAELLAKTSGYDNLPTMVNVVYYVATPIGFGMAGVFPGRAAYPAACAAWVLAIGFVLWTGVSSKSASGAGGGTFEYGGAGTQTYTTYAGSGLGLLTGATASPGDAWTLAAGGTGEEDRTDALAGFKAKGLLVAVGVFALCNPYTISEGFRWCQALHAGERPARWVALGLQGGSAVGALVAFLLF